MPDEDMMYEDEEDEEDEDSSTPREQKPRRPRAPRRNSFGKKADLARLVDLHIVQRCTIREIAEDFGVTKRTIDNHLASPEFEALAQQYLDSLQSRSVIALAWRNLIDVAEHGTPGARARACAIILDRLVGKVVDRIEVTTPAVSIYSHMSDDEVIEEAKRLEAHGS